jgi:putative phosphoesterase
MKIGVISDTHIKSSEEKIPEKAFRLFSGVDLILHAGDMVNPIVIDELNTLAKVEAVKGNMDKADNPYPLKKTLAIENLKIGLIHGFGPPLGLRERISKEFTHINAIVYGHSHWPYNKKIKEILFFNPGSPTDKIFAPYNSVGILHIDNDRIQGEIIKI